MKLAEILLLSLAELVVICRGSYWDQLNAHDAFSDNWSGEANQQLMEGIHQRFTSTNPYALSHTTPESTPGRSTSGVPEHFMLEDQFMWPPTYPHHIASSPGELAISWPDRSHTDSVISNSRVRSFESTPVDDDFLESLPPSDEYVDYFPEGLKTADEGSGLATSSNHEISRIARENVSLLDRIHLVNEEAKVHQLVFHSDVLKIPKFGYQLHTSRKAVFEDIWAQRKAESSTNLPGLMIKRNELASLAKHLNRLHKQGGPVENFRPLKITSSKEFKPSGWP
ncbi:hypothetical protein PCANC_15527 [Puccinia coronata f. sp. avenae]|uniref:Uncharacterized protein n=1 Tax=Puccinia coronata f. sp. avenae TaxID=200324 RepID=A0A2N5SIR7_9BASI|nr:hypothetical protein PCANC_15527 [Puccinia coronata f. sp. avenae]